MRVKTSELQGAALDWAVAKCEGNLDRGEVIAIGNQTWCWEDGERRRYIPSTDWSQGGPIIEREKINLQCPRGINWQADLWVEERLPTYGHHRYGSGATPLIAAMRCYVASKLGDEIDVPDELS